MSTTRFFGGPESKESVNQQPPLILVMGDIGSGKTALISNVLNYTIASGPFFSLHEWKHDNKKAILVDCPSFDPKSSAVIDININKAIEKFFESSAIIDKEMDSFLLKLKQKNAKIGAVVCTYRPDALYLEPSYKRADQVAKKLGVPFVLVATHCSLYTIKNPAQLEAKIEKIPQINISATVFMNNISPSDLGKEIKEDQESLSQARIEGQKKFNEVLATTALFGDAAKCLPDDEYILRDKPQQRSTMP